VNIEREKNLSIVSGNGFLWDFVCSNKWQVKHFCVTNNHLFWWLEWPLGMFIVNFLTLQE